LLSPERFDFVVVGSGLAGLSFALRVADLGRVAVLTKAELFESNTSYAQGGIAAAVGETDSWQLHEEDTLTAGAGLCDREAVRHLVQQAPAAVEWLMRLGAHFDGANGPDEIHSLALGREGGHSRRRIVHHADKTGWEVERAVCEAVRKSPAITVVENAFVTDLVLVDGRCAGVRARLADIGDRVFAAGATMIATGGCGRMYQHTTNPRIATGDGVAMAARAGARVVNMEFIQFHPTTLYHPQMRSYLISEAVRGAGGILRNHLGTRFMYDYDARLELAPRDVVARAIDAEMKRLDTWCVYLDLTHLPASDIVEEFPTIYEKLRSVGIQMHRDWIPVVPAQHYSCGGIATGLTAQTTVPGLFAAGEAACTGVHGANRLASNSLLEAIVFSASAAEHIRSCGPEPPAKGEIPRAQPPHCIAEVDAVRLRRALQRTMTEHVGIVRTTRGLALARERIDQIEEEYFALPQAPYAPYSLETRNLLQCAHMVVEAALVRDANVGLHFNADLAEEASAR
jgi:L-aspartate oxidase